MIFFLIFLIFAAWALQSLMSRSLQGVSCSLRVEEFLVEPDTPFRVIFTVENHSRLPVLFLRCRCTVPRDAVLCSQGKGRLSVFAQTQEYSFVCFLMPKQRLEHGFSLKLPKRGWYRIHNLHLAAGDFLGTTEQDSYCPGECEVVILPRRSGDEDVKNVSGGMIGERSVQRWIHEDPILSAGFREYTGREPQKTISWPRSLQSGRLMVRQMDHTAEDRVTVLFSLFGGARDSLEPCFSLCRSICEDLENAKLPYAFLHNGMLSTSVGLLPPVEAGLGKQHLGVILEALGRAVPESTGNLQQLVRKAQLRSQDCCCYILIVPHVTADVRAAAARLQNMSGAQVRIVCGEGLL